MPKQPILRGSFALALGSVLSVLLCTIPAQADGPDVIVSNLLGQANYGTQGDIGIFAIGTVSCNVGDEDLDWIASTPDHPVIAQNLYRLHEGRFEQIGMAWLKHGFAAPCECSGGQSECEGTCGYCVCSGSASRLAPGCSDIYTSGLNGSQAILGPRSEVNAFTGAYPYPYTIHFDQSGDAKFKRLQVHVDDLNPVLNEGAVYFAEGHYVAPDDATEGNGENNASWKRASVTGPDVDGEYTLTLTGAVRTEEPAVHGWLEEDPSVDFNIVQVPGEGVFRVGATATLLNNGFYRYEYAVHNLNSDRSGGSFSVPLPVGIPRIIENVGFHDIDYHSGDRPDPTDWTFEIQSDQIVWSTVDYETDTPCAEPSDCCPMGSPCYADCNLETNLCENRWANALRWSSLYNFRFDCNIPPDETTLTLGLFKPGTPSEIPVSTVGPSLATPDCNQNEVPDVDDIQMGTSLDCDENLVPDECQADCNNNDVADTCDITDGVSDDCNDNGKPDDCEIRFDSSAPGGPYFCDPQTVCDPDCNDNGVPDSCDLAASGVDCNENLVPDECDPDCDGDTIPDDCDPTPFPDQDMDGIPDCDDACPSTSPPGACVCPEMVECCFGPDSCFCCTTIEQCIEVLDGTPSCQPSELCREGCLYGDINEDAILDQHDWTALQNCFSGSTDNKAFVAQNALCVQWFDFDLDGDVDGADHAAWLSAQAE